MDEGRRSGAQPQPQPALRSINQAVKRGFAHQLGRRDRAGELMPSNNNTINDLILGRRNDTARRVKRNLADLYQVMNDTAVDFTNYSLNSDDEIKRNSSINGWILERNGTASSRRVKRDLDNQLNVINDTALDFTNESLTYEDDNFINKTNGTALSSALGFNISIYNANLMREKCTLLNFFTRLLQYF